MHSTNGYGTPAGTGDFEEADSTEVFSPWEEVFEDPIEEFGDPGAVLEVLPEVDPEEYDEAMDDWEVIYGDEWEASYDMEDTGPEALIPEIGEAVELWGGTSFPMLREAVAESLADLDDEALAAALAADGFDAESLEGFMQVLGDIGKAIGGALPAIGTGAATGASVGSVVPGIGTGIGAAVGGILGGLGNVLSRLGRGRSRPRPAGRRPRPAGPPRPSRPAPGRPGVRRRPSPPTTPSPPAQRPSGSTPPSTAAQTLLRLLTNPQLIQAITSLALGRNGRESIEVAGRPIPTTAFAEMLSELAQESTFDEDSMPAAPESYLLDEDGEELVELSSPGERAGALLGFLAAEAWGIELPGPMSGEAFDVDVVGDGPEGDVPFDGAWPGGPGEPEDSGFADAHVWETIEPTRVARSMELWEPDGEEDGAEAVPAFIAVGGLVVSAAGLGLGVFDRLERHLLSGSFSVSSHAASYIHNPSPRGLRTHTRRFRFPISAHHPRHGFGRQTFWFDLILEYDGFNIRRVQITEDRGSSSSLTSSSFSISFTPSAYSAPNEPIAKILFNINGRWDPIGSGDESFSGSILVDAQGRMPRLRIRARRWIRVGRATSSGGGRVPRPTTATHTTTVSFARPGGTRLTGDKIRHVHRFYTRLPASVRSEIEAGRLPIRLVGRASTTASVSRNQTIARARAQAVAAALRDVAGSSASIVTAVHGELGARTPDDREDPSERRVDIEISYPLYR